MSHPWGVLGARRRCCICTNSLAYSNQSLQMPGCMDSHLGGRDGSFQGAWDQALLSVAMEDGEREKGQRAEGRGQLKHTAA